MESIEIDPREYNKSFNIQLDNNLKLLEENNCQHFVNSLKRILPDRPIYDFGCGTGYYVNELQKDGYVATGFDIIQSSNSHTTILEQDLTLSMVCGIKGTIICINLMEYIDPNLEILVFNNMIKFSSGKIIMVWGSPSENYINGREKSYFIPIFKRLGYSINENQSLFLRSRAKRSCKSMARNIFVFEKN